jgi:hypothetical protein
MLNGFHCPQEGGNSVNQDTTGDAPQRLTNDAVDVHQSISSWTNREELL